MSQIFADPRGHAQAPAYQEHVYQDHVDKARSIIARQRLLIAKLRARGSNCEQAEELLAIFEESLAFLEANASWTGAPRR